MSTPEPERVSLPDLYDAMVDAAEGEPYDVEAGLEKLHRWIDEEAGE